MSQQFVLRSPNLDRVVKNVSEFHAAAKKRGHNSLKDFVIAASAGSTVFPENLKLKSSETLDGVMTNTYYAYVETPLERKELEFTLSTATPGTYCLAAVADNKMVDAGTDANVELKLITATEYAALDGYKIRMAMFDVTENKIELTELTALPVFHTYAPFPLNASESGE